MLAYTIDTRHWLLLPTIEHYHPTDGSTPAFVPGIDHYGYTRYPPLRRFPISATLLCRYAVSAPISGIDHCYTDTRYRSPLIPDIDLPLYRPLNPTLSTRIPTLARARYIGHYRHPVLVTTDRRTISSTILSIPDIGQLSIPGIGHYR